MQPLVSLQLYLSFGIKIFRDTEIKSQCFLALYCYLDSCTFFSLREQRFQIVESLTKMKQDPAHCLITKNSATLSLSGTRNGERLFPSFRMSSEFSSFRKDYFSLRRRVPIHLKYLLTPLGRVKHRLKESLKKWLHDSGIWPKFSLIRVLF